MPVSHCSHNDSSNGCAIGEGDVVTRAMGDKVVVTGAMGDKALVSGAGGERDQTRVLLNELRRGEPVSRAPGPVTSAVLGFLTLGVLPVLMWHDRFRDFVDDERQRLRRFAEWARLRSSRPETMDLRAAGEDLGTRPVLSALSMLSVVGVVILFAAQLTGADETGRSLVQRVLAHTYRFQTSREWAFPLSDHQVLFTVWSVGLSVAYLFHWLQLQAYASDVRRFLRHANSLFRSAGMLPVPLPRAGVGLRFVWLIAGALLASKGAWWGLAMVLSGAAQQRYMGRESARVSRVLAQRVAEMEGLPATELARTGVHARRCPHARCYAALPAGAHFCPRCGHKLAGVTATRGAARGAT